MKASASWLLFGIVVFYFAAVLYAICRGRDVKASLKVPFAAFSFETNEPGGANKKALPKSQAQALQGTDLTK
jgi:hypothetical protein